MRRATRPQLRELCCSRRCGREPEVAASSSLSYLLNTTSWLKGEATACKAAIWEFDSPRRLQNFRSVSQQQTACLGSTQPQVQVLPLRPVCGALAHSGEHRTCNAEAVGAKPTGSTNFATVAHAGRAPRCHRGGSGIVARQSLQFCGHGIAAVPRPSKPMTRVRVSLPAPILGTLVQRVEHRLVTPKAVGSRPTRPANFVVVAERTRHAPPKRDHASSNLADDTNTCAEVAQLEERCDDTAEAVRSSRTLGTTTR